MARKLSTFALALAVALCGTASADAAKRFTIRGAGFGHGVGMSQYGAMGYASHGWDYKAILGHYYTGTRLGVLKEPREVRVLLQSTSGSAAFSGASRAGGRTLSPTKAYRARGRAGGQVELLSARGRSLATVVAPLRVTGPGLLTLKGRAGNGRTDGAYRGALEFRGGTFGGVNAINALAVDEYVKGVIPLESPASWPIEALKAQAVAARTYALTTSKGGAGFEHYPDTRSQVYGGAGAEQPSTNAAADATARQLVTYDGTPVPTYFFSTSGGRTEDVENTTLGTEPKPWLRSVEDEYDSVSPKHRWGPILMSYGAARSKLRGLVSGRFKGIKVVQRGSSPRVVAADVIGSRGITRVDGATLRARFGLYDSWAYFTSIKTRPVPPPAEPAPESGGAVPIVARVPDIAGLAGHVVPARRGARVGIQRRTGGRWVTVDSTKTDRGGRYRAGVPATGLYRVRYKGAAGPAVRVAR
ncbi:MAG TPA: SpoIID/LytB domain-containing protein [Solirubrobacteraceae bacterium]|nr:SpoIID/LytB domain-containing protein [Solirubrobacteraceae bacterium]